jgi:hypothetical protein
MKNRVLGLAAVAAAAGLVGSPLGQSVNLLQVRSATAPNAKAPGGMQLPQGGIGSMLGALLDGRGYGGGRFHQHKYKGARGHSVAEGKRRARRSRNRLRARGQFRAAVR